MRSRVDLHPRKQHSSFDAQLERANDAGRVRNEERAGLRGQAFFILERVLLSELVRISALACKERKDEEAYFSRQWPRRSRGRAG